MSGPNVTNRKREMIEFPSWVGEPTQCKMRTFSVVLTGNLHGAIRIERSFPNLPIVKRRRIGRPGYYYGWAEQCPVTGKWECQDRNCELHYMLAPLNFPDVPPGVSAEDMTWLEEETR